MDTISDRLREERERLGLSQAAFAELGRVQRRAQANYEAGDRYPDALYLAGVAAGGADVLYILTGQRSPAALTADELELLERFRAASLDGKMAALGALKGVTEASRKVTVAGDVNGQVFEGDATNTAPVTFTIIKSDKERKK